MVVERSIVSCQEEGTKVGAADGRDRLVVKKQPVAGLSSKALGWTHDRLDMSLPSPSRRLAGRWAISCSIERRTSGLVEGRSSQYAAKASSVDSPATASRAVLEAARYWVSGTPSWPCSSVREDLDTTAGTIVSMMAMNTAHCASVQKSTESSGGVSRRRGAVKTSDEAIAKSIAVACAS